MMILRKILLPAFLLLSGSPAGAQNPLAKPLADFDKLVSQLKPSTLIGEPIRAGETSVIPFAAVKFGLTGGNATIAFGGILGAKIVPIGLLIVEGDDVRAEFLPEPEEKPSALQQLLQAILDRKVIVMGNGLNVGEASGTIKDFAPLVSGLSSILSGGQTSIIGNALNLGRLETQKKDSEPADLNPKSPQKPERP